MHAKRLTGWPIHRADAHKYINIYINTDTQVDWLIDIYTNRSQSYKHTDKYTGGQTGRKVN